MTLNPHNPVKSTKKIPAIKAFIQTSFLDWRSQICSVVFLGRCNFRCPYCHNRDLVLWPQKLSNLRIQDIRDCISSYEGWLDGVVISGGEPCLNPDLPHLIDEFRNLGLKIKLDTNGSRPELLKQIIRDGLIDYVAMDFKAPLNEFSYRRCTGVWTDVKAIGKSLDLLLKGNVDYEFRVTICPGLLDLEDIKYMGERIEGAKRFVLQNFVPQNTLDASMSELVPYNMEKLEKMKQVISHNVEECLIISS
jgi:pyruvate formate lyase activating enzyme